MRRQNAEQGFTLIELLVVILIIGVLTGVAVPAVMNQRAVAQETALKSDLRNAGTIMEGQGKFNGALPDDLQISDGVHLKAMRTVERDNKIVSSQFIDGKSPMWATFKHNLDAGTKVTTGVVTGSDDSYKKMNYRTTTVTEGTNRQVGQYVYVSVPEGVKKGETYTVGVAMRQNYTGHRNINIEFKNDAGGNSWPGGIATKRVDMVAGEWKYVTFTGKSTGDGVNTLVLSLYGPMTTGQTLDATGAVLVKGDTVDIDAALSTTGQDFCIQGYHESEPTNIWRYSSLDGGMENATC